MSSKEWPISYWHYVPGPSSPMQMMRGAMKVMDCGGVKPGETVLISTDTNKTRIAGFRPGKVPYEIIVKKLGDEAVFEEALETLGQEAYKEALETAEIDAFAPGTLDEVVSRAPLILRYTVPLAPEVDLGSYREVRLEFDEPEVTDEAVEAMLEELRQGQALIEPADRPADVRMGH